MAKFPTSMALPSDFYAARAKRDHEVVQACWKGIYFRSFVIVFELTGVFLINSSALFLDAISSILDVLSSAFIIFCLKLAQRPPDHDHPFGHGRYEPFGGLLAGILLVVLGSIMGVQQIFGLIDQTEHIMTTWAWIFPLTAMLILEIAFRYLQKVAKQVRSPALAVDAVHYRIDSLTSLLAFITLIIASYFPQWGGTIDHLGAIVISLFMLGIGIFASRENFHQLMDKAPEGKWFACVRQAAIQTHGVKGVEKIRIQQYGPDAHIDIDIEVQPELSVQKAHKISQHVRIEIQKAWPAVRDVTVHIEPYYKNDH
jgi:cation diffusion facilitator family transporter